jgi:RNA polymerase II subunit A C-terminal domain phosphatase
MVVIVDDRQDVWNFAPNLIHVRPYHFFGLTGDINSPLGSLRNKFNDIKLNDISEREDQDSYLLYLQNTLRSIHHAYYAAHDEIVQKEVEESKKEIPDTKVIVPSVRRQVLQGVSLVFSWIVPINVPKDERRPYVLARSLGAFVTETVDNSTTHVVSNRLDTPEAYLNLGKFNQIQFNYALYIPLGTSRQEIQNN